MHNDLLKEIRDDYEIQERINTRLFKLAENANSLCGFDALNWEQSDRYCYYKRIHELLELSDVIGESTLKRIGKKNDGGYVMACPMSREKIAYSIGISDDVSWDKAMSKFGYDIYMYDHTIEGLPEDNNRFHWQKKGITGELENKCEDLLSLEEMLSINGHNHLSGMILKMDVEGYEWDVFNNADLDTLNRFDQIVVELHGLLEFENKEKILGALERIASTFFTVHVHANNWGDVDYEGNLVMPTMLEVTFVNKNAWNCRKSEKILPILIDQKCVGKLPEIKLGKWNV